MFGIKVFRYLLKLVSIIMIVAFVVLNRQETELYLSPIMSISLPLWLLGLLIFASGFIVGALLLWLNSWPIRRELSKKKKELSLVEKDRDALNETLRTEQQPATALKEQDIV